MYILMRRLLKIFQIELKVKSANVRFSNTGDDGDDAGGGDYNSNNNNNKMPKTRKNVYTKIGIIKMAQKANTIFFARFYFSSFLDFLCLFIFIFLLLLL